MLVRVALLLSVVAQAQTGAPSDLESARAARAEAQAAWDAGDHEASVAAAVEGVEILLSSEALYASEEGSDLLHDLGIHCYNSGNLNVAHEAMSVALEQRERLLPEDDARLPWTSTWLAFVEQGLGNDSASEGLYRSALEFYERRLGEENVELHRARVNLAGVLTRVRRFDEAGRLYEQVIRSGELHLPSMLQVVVKARAGLAQVMQEQGDLGGAQAILEQELDRLRSLPGLDDTELLIMINLVAVQSRLGEYEAAIELGVEATEAMSGSYPVTHRYAGALRGMLVTAYLRTGRSQDALELTERSLEQLRNVLPETDARVVEARGNVALTFRVLGWNERALRSFEEIVAFYAVRHSVTDEREMDAARSNLVQCLRQAGELVRARATAEALLESRRATLPENHHNVLDAQQVLASVLGDMGDFQGARELEESILEARLETFGPSHPDVVMSKTNLANTLTDLGFYDEARRLHEELLEGYVSRRGEGDLDVYYARKNLAVCLGALGRIEEAAAMEESVLEGLERLLPVDSFNLVTTRGNLALRLAALGDHERSRALWVNALESYERTLPEGHEDRLKARSELVRSLSRLGEDAEARRLASAQLKALRKSARNSLGRLSPRVLEERSITRLEMFSVILDLCDGDPTLQAELFEALEVLRGIGRTAAAARLRVAPDSSERQAEKDAADELARCVRAGAGRDAISAARRGLEALERQNLERVTALPGVSALLLDPSVEELGKVLGESHALVSFSVIPDAEGETRLISFVVDGGGSMELFDYGAIHPIRTAVEDWRRSLGVASGARGIATKDREPSAADLESITGGELRALIWDPLAHALEGCTRVTVVLDDVLHLVPIDALPTGEQRDGRPEVIGERLTIEVRSSVQALLWPKRRALSGHSLVALGGADFARSTVADDAAADRQADPEGELAVVLRGGAWEEGFTPLPGTLREVRSIADLAGSAHEELDLTLLDGRGASLEALASAAPQARWLHIATHGWFAPDSIRSTRDRGDADADSRGLIRLSANQQVRGASPMLLCGLALAGANRRSDELGRAPGLLTAHELASWTLENCELAVLSACDTNVGVRRAGQGVASLQTALHEAGARCVITSLWKVPDAATQELMVEFYRRLWIEGQDVHRALWGAKMHIRFRRDAQGESVHGLRAWAGWVLTGTVD